MIETSGFSFPSGFECLMFLNTDGSIGVLIGNSRNDAQQVAFVNEEFSVKYMVPAKSLVSLSWKE